MEDIVLSVRLFICSIVATMCTVTSLSIGCGPAAAIEPPAGWFEGIFGAITKGLGIGAGQAAEAEGVSSLETAYRLQRIGRPDIPEEVQMAHWEDYAKSAEPLPTRRAVKKAAEWACNTAVTLLGHADKFSWAKAKDDAVEQAAKTSPFGETYMLYKELTSIIDNFVGNCWCAAIAELAVLVAQYRFCKPLGE
jgi:hypothetical protein